LPVVARWRNAVRDSDLDQTSRLVALVLSTYMHADGNGAYPSRRTIANGCGIHAVRAVDAAIRRLEAAGLLQVNRSRGRTSSIYRALLPDSNPIPPTAREPNTLTHADLAYLD
jgi:hypothetical protein